MWQWLSILQYIQFPWRWLGTAVFFLTLFATYPLIWMSSHRTRLMYAALFVWVMALHSADFHPESYLDSSSALYSTDADRIQTQMSAVLPDYIPLDLVDVIKPPSSLFKVPLGLDQFVEPVVNRGHEKLFKTHFSHDTLLQIAIARFPGWRAEVDGAPVPLENGDQGTIAVMVPPGEHWVGVRFGRTPVRALSETVSVISLALFFWWLLLPSKHVGTVQQPSTHTHSRRRRHVTRHRH